MKRVILGFALLAFAFPLHAQVVTGGGSAEPTPQTGTGAWVRNNSPTFTPSANTPAINVTGGSVTGSGTSPLLDLAGAWNTSGDPTGIKLNITRTATGFGGKLLDLQINGTSKAYIGEFGQFTGDGALFSAFYSAIDRTVLSSGAYFGWTSSGPANTPDVELFRDAANTLGLRNDAHAQTFNLYNTYTDSSNYERLAAIWSSNVLYLRNQNAGTGSARMMIPVTGATTVAGLPSASTAGVGARAFVTDGSTTVILGLGTTVTGGGANKVPVYSDGTNWIVG